MPSSLDPATLTADERSRELARLLAAGLLRLRRPQSKRHSGRIFDRAESLEILSERA